MITVVSKKNSLHTVKPKELLKIGFDPAVLWSVDREIDGKEYVVPTTEDVTLFHTTNKDDFISEEEAKKLLNV